MVYKVKEAIHDFAFGINKLFTWDNYVARSNYDNISANFTVEYEKLKFMRDNGVLLEFCRKNDLDYAEVQNAILLYENLEYLVKNYNSQYVTRTLKDEKEYLDNILIEIDKNILLDEDQRKVVVEDEDYTLVIAGAGAGKTTTIAAKVKYLVERKNIKPEEILIISFTNKAVQELKERINENLKINAPITTFHAAGYAIIKKEKDILPRIVREGTLYNLVSDYLKNHILKDEIMVDSLLLFFSSYFNSSLCEEDLKKYFIQGSIPLSTLKNDLDEVNESVRNIKNKKNVTINNEYVRSYEEVIIANFLYLNNLEYQYEPIYKYQIKDAKKLYTPDFIIKQGDKTVYLEHFGIGEDGTNARYSSKELEVYKKHINDKILFHKKHGTKLIYTFSKYKDNKPLIKHLEQFLLKEGFKLNPKPKREMLKKVANTDDIKYVSKLTLLIIRFINNFKVMGYSLEDFKRMSLDTDNVRSKLFLKICEACYLEYQKYLKENNYIDFQDMINESSHILQKAKIENQQLNFKYIIVDEYQDISKQRFDLTKALSEICKAKIMVVGDDWQSIYAFSGSDIELFTKFRQTVGYGNVIKIVHTYRNSQELIDIAGDFISKNHNQIRKDLISPKRMNKPVIIYTYDPTLKINQAGNKVGANYNLACAIEKALDDIYERIRKENLDVKNHKILFLARFNFEINHLQNTGLFEIKGNTNQIRSVKYPSLNINFMTAHSSKGLGYDDVVIINGKNGTYGFPSQIENDPVLAFVMKNDKGITYAEERRLFYVALTRTKNRVYIAAPSISPSEFLIELKNNYKDVVLEGVLDEEITHKKKNTCPICGYPLQFRMSHSYGIPLFICSNEPEICSFMTNDLSGGTLRIQKCDKCYDGYLIVKKNKEKGTCFLGCTNYEKNQNGCNNIISAKNYNFEVQLTLPPTVISDLLECIYEVSKKHLYGVTTYIKILRGSKSKVIIENGLKAAPYYSKYDSFTTKEIKSVILEQIQLGNIYQSLGTYPIIKLTNKGLNLINKFDANSLEDNTVINLNKIPQTVFNAIKNISSRTYLNKEEIIAFLKGEEISAVKRFKLQDSKYFGIYKTYDRNVLNTAIERLLKKKYLLETKNAGLVLHPTILGLTKANNFHSTHE